jgi:uncharacterized damage-inducible protein DinB
MNMEEIENYIDMLRALRAEAVPLGEGLDAGALNWRPTATDTNSIFQLLTHIIGSEAWWLHQIVGGVDIHRDRPAEFAVGGTDIASLKVRYEAVARHSEEVLRGLSPADLSVARDTTMGPHTVRWCIAHVIDHTARHIGHIELTCQLWHARKAA